MAKVIVGMGKDCIVIHKPDSEPREFIVLTIPEFRDMMEQLTEILIAHIKEIEEAEWNG